MTTSLPDLIIRGLGGQHLHGFLPGNDNKAAIAAAVASMLGWSSTGVYGNVTRRGIGEWAHYGHHSERKSADAIVFVTWADVLEVVARGCADGHREAYEVARTAWCAQIGGYHPARGQLGGYPGTAATRWLREATAALIRHGCQQTAAQGTLF
jgi:hypothetical protein